ncbi:aminotransferase-like domain-containing protein [Lacticaseibacillus zhaodongensis]|uniref:aminotransferase-like domain-containing protein n=1 Tax=Lacticaseibacillus zhaodongensis TaxID=2668065 RepID=UPI0018AF8324|nr:PLP-dependent aminotransferase family protein [Lacticaseibacillus zhaodongensis]
MRLANRIDVNSDSGLEALLAAPAQGQVSLAGGLPDPELFPDTQIAAGFAAAMQTDSQCALQYASASGYAPLRAKLAERMRRDGIDCAAENVMVTQGAQQALDLVARMYINEGDGLVVEGPTYPGALAAFDTYQPQYYTVAMQEDGLDIGQLRRILQQHAIKLLYTVPDFQNPTGTVMSMLKRRQLLQLANQYDFMILEDAPYRDLRYRGISLPTLRELDKSDHVIHVRSFSKILSPGLRLGWLTASQDILNQLVSLKSGADLESSSLMMRAINAYMDANDLDAHVNALRHRYAEKCAAMVDTLVANLPANVQFSRPDGGFFVWVQLPEGCDSEVILSDCKKAVSFVPATTLYPSHTIKNGMRLAFTNPSVAEIKRACTELSATIRVYVGADIAAQSK